MADLWYNYRTGEHTSDNPTDETIADYLPQDESALAIYRLYRIGGLSVLDAMENVLMTAIGKQPRHEPNWPDA